MSVLNIRNAGFERGDLEFWTVGFDKSHQVVDTEHERGDYSLEVTADAVGLFMVVSQDYFRVTANSILSLSMWVKGVVNRDMQLAINYYDADLESIDYEYTNAWKTTAAWQKHEGEIVIPEGCSYITLVAYLTGATEDDVFYFDSMSACLSTGGERVLKCIELCDLTNKTASGDTTAQKFCLYGFRECYAEIEVTSITGTAPTCDVTICETDRYGNERVIGTFTQFNAVTDQRVGLASSIGVGMYVKYAMGGTVTDCDFKVSVIGVR